jgi:glucan 1,3-beta-glucosidase
MRAGALPSPANQARALHDILERGKRENFRVNVIEAFDQPWKRYQEGTVGGHWGLITDPPRVNKFAWGLPVSNHPFWPWQAAFGVLLAATVFAMPRLVNRQGVFPDRLWLALAAIAAVSGITAGWTFAAVPVESLGLGGWLRSVTLAVLALAVPLACAAALANQIALPGFAAAIGPSAPVRREPLERWLSWLLIALFILAMETALGLAFDPRYRDFAFAPLTSAAVPFLLLASMSPRQAWRRPVAETAGAAVLAVAAAFIVVNEGLSNWQAIWTGCALAVLSVTLARVRAAPG